MKFGIILATPILLRPFGCTGRSVVVFADARDPVAFEQAAALLVAESVIEAETDRGDILEVWTISNHDAVVSASAPRLAVSPGLGLRCRAVTDTGPIYIHGVVETAEYQPTARAAITIRSPTSLASPLSSDTARVSASPPRRRSERPSATASSPTRCFPSPLIDLSESGCAVTTSDRRVRVRDRLWLYARFLEGEISTEIRIAHTTPDPNTVTAGCVFLDPGPDAAVVNQVSTRQHGRP